MGIDLVAITNIALLISLPQWVMWKTLLNEMEWKFSDSSKIRAYSPQSSCELISSSFMDMSGKIIV